MDEIIDIILARLRTAFRRGVVSGVDDGGDGLRVQVNSWGFPRWMEAVLPYGLSFLPQDGAEVGFFGVSSRQGHQVTLLVGDRRYRITGLARGEVVLHDDQNRDGATNRVHLTRDGIRIETTRPDGVVIEATGPVTINSNDVRLGNGADAALVRWPQLQSFLQGLVLQVTGAANLTTGAVTGTTTPPSVPSMGTTRVIAK